jgi:uncharacterized protein YbcC (UPF0753/DUF2309 family)
MSADTHIRDSIEQAAETVGPVWPLPSFVTTNPLGGFENRPFHEAVREGNRLFAADGYPSTEVFRRAWTDDRIDREILETGLADHGYDPNPEAALDRTADAEHDPDPGEETPTDRVDRLLTKWLAAFLNQGKAHWPMPDRERGFL